MMNIITERIYNAEHSSGYRVLVDRLWPRGISRKEADLDDQWKDLAPSNDLRKWFHHDVRKWEAFRKKYLRELHENKDKAKEHLSRVSGQPLVLLYGAKDEAHNHAIILKEYLEKLAG